MEISLHDERSKLDEPGFNTHLGVTTSWSLERGRQSHILDIKTDLAYNLMIRLTKADMDQLRNRLIEIDAKSKSK